MFRSHVPTVQASEAHAIVNSADQKGRFAGVFACKVGRWCPCFGLPNSAPFSGN